MESHTHLNVKVHAADVYVDVDVDVAPPERFQSEVFTDLTAASEFFRKDAVGWSPRRDGRLEALRLDTDEWRVEPGVATRVESSFFDALPVEAAEFDHVLVMRGVPVVWSSPAEIAPDPHATLSTAN